RRGSQLLAEVGSPRAINSRPFHFTLIYLPNQHAGLLKMVAEAIGQFFSQAAGSQLLYTLQCRLRTGKRAERPAGNQTRGMLDGAQELRCVVEAGRTRLFQGSNAG